MTDSVELIMHSDGGSRGNPGNAAYGVAFLVNGEVIHEITGFMGTATNNEAEYSGLVSGLVEVQRFSEVFPDLQVSHLTVKLDSQLVVNQVNGLWKIKEPRLQDFALKARNILRELPFPSKLMYVPRAENAVADLLVNQCLDAHSLE